MTGKKDEKKNSTIYYLARGRRITGGRRGVWIFPGSKHWLRSHLNFLYHSEQQFTMVNRFFNVTSFSHFTMVNASLVCCVSNTHRMKAKFTTTKPSEKVWFTEHLSILFRSLKSCQEFWETFRDFAEFVCTNYIHVLSISLAHSNLLTISQS
mgnify:FL=1